MNDELRQRSIVDKIARDVSNNSLVSLPYETLIMIGVDEIAESMMSKDVTIDENETSELDFSYEEFEAILNRCISEQIYAYFAGDSRLTLRREVHELSENEYELKLIYTLELKGGDLNLCKDEIHYDLSEDESPYSKSEVIDKIAEVYMTDITGLIKLIKYDPRLKSLSSIKEELENATEIDAYDIISENLSIDELWADLIEASTIPIYCGTFETSQSYIIDLKNLD